MYILITATPISYSDLLLYTNTGFGKSVFGYRTLGPKLFTAWTQIQLPQMFCRKLKAHLQYRKKQTQTLERDTYSVSRHQHSQYSQVGIATSEQNVLWVVSAAPLEEQTIMPLGRIDCLLPPPLQISWWHTSSSSLLLIKQKLLNWQFPH